MTESWFNKWITYCKWTALSTRCTIMWNSPQVTKKIIINKNKIMILKLNCYKGRDSISFINKNLHNWILNRINEWQLIPSVMTITKIINSSASFNVFKITTIEIFQISKESLIIFYCFSKLVTKSLKDSLNIFKILD